MGLIKTEVARMKQIVGEYNMNLGAAARTVEYSDGVSRDDRSAAPETR